ncbi:ATP-NAD kinase-like domain-containing protein [Protomyces lactucae-debilis]|uniref:ATP-NAD kinase-like domain-containing protein n=1 Tax=Protomyces lactucae-debilis TaxID=2754530 RepID=A0A1Y2EVZ0_PROLT|nr:ATP-NAD kinase-like domain-containing protein [Protomyces lactucae-debilis]ORY75424.1 ATP-NAD kinase-like domain-containing protein [Protomyces lactucae-debilis]
MSIANAQQVHISICNDDLKIYRADNPPARDGHHARVSLDGLLRNCCSVGKPFKERIISLYDVLGLEYKDARLTISYLRLAKKKDLPEHAVDAFTEEAWRAAYRKTQPRKRIKVLLNPFGGTRKARSLWQDFAKPIFEAAQYKIDLQETTHRNHAHEIAAALDVEQYDVLMCISGDGLPHEVFNGLASRPDANRALKLPVAFLPAGSGNGSAKSIYDTHNVVECALAVVKGVETPIDLMSITQGQRRFLSYFSVSFGVIADGDLGTEHMRWMGEARFTVGVLQRIMTRTAYPCTISLDIVQEDKKVIRKEYDTRRDVHRQADNDAKGLPPLKYGTVNDPVPASWRTEEHPKMGCFYAALMPYMSSAACIFPAARPHSGAMDLFSMESDLPFFSALSTVSAVDSAKHYDSKHAYYAKLRGFRLTPHGKEGFISIDGESMPWEPLQAELHPGLGCIITKNGEYYSQWQHSCHNVD